MIKWTGLAPWVFEFLFPGSLTSTFLVPQDTLATLRLARRAWRVHSLFQVALHLPSYLQATAETLRLARSAWRAQQARTRTRVVLGAVQAVLGTPTLRRGARRSEAATALQVGIENAFQLLWVQGYLAHKKQPPP